MRVAVAMSGGVDSSVAALLLAREGAEVVGLSMHLWDHDRDGNGAAAGRCCTLDDLNVARRAAEAIGIPHFVLNLEERFTEAVVKPFAQAYLEGRTPIPCTVCNTEVKFKSLLQRAAALGCETVATGHYARVTREGDAPRLRKGLDPAKDQSYFLWDLTPQQLERARFPVGELRKGEVREIAREAGLPNWDKPDSQEVCFVPREGHAAFIRKEAEALGLPLPTLPGARPGVIADRGGTVLGTHDGTYQFTVGQRRGLGLAAGEPVYVLEVDAGDSRVVVGPADALLATEVALEDVNLLLPVRASAERVAGDLAEAISAAPAGAALAVSAKIRYRHQEQPALLALEEPSRMRGGRARLLFETPVRGPAPGQSAVFFSVREPDLVLGGGTIARAGGGRKA